MKTLLAAALFSALASTSFASGPEMPAIMCSQGQEFKITIPAKEDDTMFGCEGFVTGLNICFVGAPHQALTVLKQLNSNDVLGDEYSMRRFRARKSALKYDIYDGPNGEVLHGVAIPPCYDKISTKPTSDDETVASDSKNSCSDIAVGAVTLALRKSIPSTTDVGVGLISEDDQAAFFKVELIAPIPGKNEVVSDKYEVVLKSANCEVIDVRRYAK